MPAILGSSHRLEVVDLLAPAQTDEDVFLFGPPIFWNDQEDLLADRLPGGVSEELLGATVPRCDDTVQRLADDRIIGRIDDCGEQCAELVVTRKSRYGTTGVGIHLVGRSIYGVGKPIRRSTIRGEPADPQAAVWCAL